MCLAIPGKVLEVTESEDPLFRAGRVSFAGIVKTIQLACTPSAVVGDYVLVHVGFAIAVVDEAEARHTLRLIGVDGENAAGIPTADET